MKSAEHLLRDHQCRGTNLPPEIEPMIPLLNVLEIAYRNMPAHIDPIREAA